MRKWEETLLGLPQKDRRRALDLRLAERIAPLNAPAFVPDSDGDVFLFAQNLRLFWGLYLPIGERDPAGRAAEVAAALGLPGDEASLADLPPRRLRLERIEVAQGLRKEGAGPRVKHAEA